MMISKTKNPVIKDTKHYIDLNESAYQSRWRLMAAFQTIAKKEAGMTSKKIKKAYSEMEKTTGIKPLVEVMDNYIGNHVVFYWGVGDYDPKDEEYKNGSKIIKHNETPEKKKETKKVETPKKKNYKTKKRAKKKSSQETLEENMRNSTVALVTFDLEA